VGHIAGEFWVCLKVDKFYAAGKRSETMIDERYTAVKSDFITALRIIYREGLSDAIARLSLRSNEGNEVMFVPRKIVN
jgi:hypothetical protein